MKHDRSPRLASSLAICGVFALAVAFGPTSGTLAVAQTAPPPPPAPNSTGHLPATPAPATSAVLPAASPGVPAPAPGASASPSPAPKGKHRGKNAPAPNASGSAAPEPSATPTSPAFATLDGTWEFQLQYIDRTEYSYLTIVQAPSGTISGTWKVDNKTYPFDGTYDGRLIKMTVKEPTTTVTMSGYVEGATDMVGLLDLGIPKLDPTAFTAEHRASTKGSVFKKGV